MREESSNLEHHPLDIGDEPHRFFFDVATESLEYIEINVHAGDMIRLFGKVTDENEITIHILSKTSQNHDKLDVDKAYVTKEEVSEIDISYICKKDEPLLLVFDNEKGSTRKNVEVSVQVLKVIEICQHCSAKIDPSIVYCPHCGMKQKKGT